MPGIGPINAENYVIIVRVIIRDEARSFIGRSEIDGQWWWPSMLCLLNDGFLFAIEFKGYHR